MFVGRRQQHLSCRARTLVDAARGARRPRRPPRRAAPLRDRGGRRARCGCSPRRLRCARSWPITVRARRARGPRASTIADRRLRTGRAPGPTSSPLGVEEPDGTFTALGDARRPLPVDRGGRRLHRPGHRHVRRGRHRPLRLVRLRAARRLTRGAPELHSPHGRNVRSTNREGSKMKGTHTPTGRRRRGPGRLLGLVVALIAAIGLTSTAAFAAPAHKDASAALGSRRSAPWTPWPRCSPAGTWATPWTPSPTRRPGATPRSPRRCSTPSRRRASTASASR